MPIILHRRHINFYRDDAMMIDAAFSGVIITLSIDIFIISRYIAVLLLRALKVDTLGAGGWG